MTRKPIIGKTNVHTLTEGPAFVKRKQTVLFKNIESSCIVYTFSGA
jgi:hypothetical protein